jgi:hypothetical protein
MSQFYAKADDEVRCRQSVAARSSITISGLNSAGEVCAFTGTVQSVETGHIAFAGYPLRVTMPGAVVTSAGGI